MHLISTSEKYVFSMSGKYRSFQKDVFYPFIQHLKCMWCQRLVKIRIFHVILLNGMCCCSDWEIMSPSQKKYHPWKVLKWSDCQRGHLVKTFGCNYYNSLQIGNAYPALHLKPIRVVVKQHEGTTTKVKPFEIGWSYHCIRFLKGLGETFEYDFWSASISKTCYAILTKLIMHFTTIMTLQLVSA